MFKKIISSVAIGSVLILGANNNITEVENTELQKAVNYAPIITQEFKATDKYSLTNVEDSSDVIESSNNLNVGKKYIISFKNDTPIKIVKK